MLPESRPTHHSRIFDSYLASSYGPLNDLSPEGLQRAADSYRRQLGRHLPQDKEARILEIGCGSGAFLLCCRQQGYSRVQGIDISPQQVEFCHRNGFRQVTQADALGYLQDGGESFDCVVMSDVLEHLPKDLVLDTLAAVGDRLRPGGQLLLKVPNLSNPLNLRSRYVDFTHESGFTLESLQQVLRATGFEVREVHGSFSPHRRLLARWLFDGICWRLFLLLYRHTLHLSREVVRGKSLIAVAERPAA